MPARSRLAPLMSLQMQREADWQPRGLRDRAQPAPRPAEPISRRVPPIGQQGGNWLAQQFYALPAPRQADLLAALLAAGIPAATFRTDAARKQGLGKLPFQRLDCYRRCLLDLGADDVFDVARQELTSYKLAAAEANR